MIKKMKRLAAFKPLYRAEFFEAGTKNPTTLRLRSVTTVAGATKGPTLPFIPRLMPWVFRRSRIIFLWCMPIMLHGAEAGPTSLKELRRASPISPRLQRTGAGSIAATYPSEMAAIKEAFRIFHHQAIQQIYQLSQSARSNNKQTEQLQEQAQKIKTLSIFNEYAQQRVAQGPSLATIGKLLLQYPSLPSNKSIGRLDNEFFGNYRNGIVWKFAQDAQQLRYLIIAVRTIQPTKDATPVDASVHGYLTINSAGMIYPPFFQMSLESCQSGNTSLPLATAACAKT